MRYLKILGLAAIAASALTAFAAPVSATVLTNGEGIAISSLEASQIGSMTTSDTEGNTLGTCTESKGEGTVENQGSTWVTGEGVGTWGGCSFTTDTITAGTLEIMSNGNGTGTVVSTGAEVTIKPPIIGSCVYGTRTSAGGGTDLGTIESGTEATLSINGIVEEQAPKRLACPDTERGIAEYKVTEPHELVID